MSAFLGFRPIGKWLVATISTLAEFMSATSLLCLGDVRSFHGNRSRTARRSRLEQTSRKPCGCHAPAARSAILTAIELQVQGKKCKHLARFLDLGYPAFTNPE